MVCKISVLRCIFDVTATSLGTQCRLLDSYEARTSLGRSTGCNMSTFSVTLLPSTSAASNSFPSMHVVVFSQRSLTIKILTIKVLTIERLTIPKKSGSRGRILTCE